MCELSKWLSHSLRAAPRLTINAFPKYLFENVQRFHLSSATNAGAVVSHQHLAIGILQAHKHRHGRYVCVLLAPQKVNSSQRHAITTNAQQRRAFGTTRH